MSRVVYEDPIHHISGKISKKFRTGYAYRKHANGDGENKAYTYVRGERDMVNHPLSTVEMAARTRFATIHALVEHRKSDVSKRSADMAAFRAQDTYKTMNKYLWAICAAEYDASSE